MALRPENWICNGNRICPWTSRSCRRRWITNTPHATWTRRSAHLPIDWHWIGTYYTRIECVRFCANVYFLFGAKINYEGWMWMCDCDILRLIRNGRDEEWGCDALKIQHISRNIPLNTILDELNIVPQSHNIIHSTTQHCHHVMPCHPRSSEDADGILFIFCHLQPINWTGAAPSQIE